MRNRTLLSHLLRVPAYRKPRQCASGCRVEVQFAEPSGPRTQLDEIRCLESSMATRILISGRPRVKIDNANTRDPRRRARKPQVQPREICPRTQSKRTKRSNLNARTRRTCLPNHAPLHGQLRQAGQFSFSGLLRAAEPVPCRHSTAGIHEHFTQRRASDQQNGVRKSRRGASEQQRTRSSSRSSGRRLMPPPRFSRTLVRSY
jgi:hypothetical protein